MHAVEKFFIQAEMNLEEAMRTIQRGGEGIALVVDDKRRLLGTITDGDIRRAILRKIRLNEQVHQFLANRPPNYQIPTTAPIGTPQEELVRTMKERVLRQIPLLDSERRVVKLALLSEFIGKETLLPFTAVVMAGGKGQRLRPLTEHLPKPMLPLHKQPIMERTIRQLRDVGATKVHITTHYKSEVIVNYFGAGQEMGVDINYIQEREPMGTAGALSLMERPDKPVLVINGDIVTQLDFRALFHFHQEQKAVMTVGVRVYEFQIPYGVIEVDDVCITQLVEKPLQTFTVNAGIYLLGPEAYDYIPSHTQFHMTDLIERLIQDKRRVVCFPIQEYWLDIGEHADYKKANEDAKNGKL